VLDAQARQRRGGDCAAGSARSAVVAQGKLDIAAHAGRQQDWLLRRVGEPAAQRCAAVQGRNVIDAGLPDRGRFDGGQQAQQARLAGAVEAEQPEAFAAGDLQLVDAEDLAPAAAVAEVGDGQARTHAADRCWTEVSTALTAKASASNTAA